MAPRKMLKKDSLAECKVGAQRGFQALFGKPSSSCSNPPSMETELVPLQDEGGAALAATPPAIKKATDESQPEKGG